MFGAFTADFENENLDRNAIFDILLNAMKNEGLYFDLVLHFGDWKNNNDKYRVDFSKKFNAKDDSIVDFRLTCKCTKTDIRVGVTEDGELLIGKDDGVSFLPQLALEFTYDEWSIFEDEFDIMKREVHYACCV